ncbi:MAG: hypothetical protein FJ109_06025 [Deltaproteobacteria bacterium]|nr:hypothetical protein [Deltaproteobacteria bacterium]
MEKDKTTRNSERKPEYRYEVLVRPGRTLSDAALASLTGEVRRVAATCFDPIPDYQVMVGTREAFEDKVLALAWNEDGSLAGFCSALLLDVPEVGEVLHLGLTCVCPAERGSGLTHKLTSRGLTTYLLHRGLFRRIWVTNCAAVLSSLGNVALHFENVYPSPFATAAPTATHRAIARAVDERYRKEIYIAPAARFDVAHFVFRGSVADTVFQKDAGDRRYHHRMSDLNLFYTALMDFRTGDEVLQVGQASVWGALRHSLRKLLGAGSKGRSGPACKPMLPVPGNGAANGLSATRATAS